MSESATSNRPKNRPNRHKSPTQAALALPTPDSLSSERYGLTVLGEAGGADDPLQAYVTMRGPDRGGAPEGTPELYFTDPDGILLQLQDPTYCSGNGYLGDECGTVENPTGRNM